MSMPDIIPARSHILLIGAPQTGQLYLACELAKAVHGRAVHVLERDPKDLHRFLDEVPTPVIVRDFSQRPLGLSDTDPWFPLAATLLKDRLAFAIITVAHSGPSGREMPPAGLFDEVWQLSEGFQYKDQMPRARENHEVKLQRPGQPPLFFRSKANAVEFDLVTDERLAVS